MSILDDFRRSVRKWLFPDELTSEIREHEDYIQLRRDYRRGYQQPQIKVKTGQPDDNVFINFIGLILDRAVSMLVGQGVEFDLPGDEETPEDEWLEKAWTANKKSILLHRAALSAAEAGTGYLKLLPNGVYDNEDKAYPRLVLIDPKWVMMDTNPEDFEQVIRYNIRYINMGPDGREQARKQIIENTDGRWTIEDFVASQQTGGRWVSMGMTPWEFDEFGPMIHWQNLPTIDSAYGAPDITDDVIIEQDKLNYVASNIAKIIRYHAHPKTIGYGTGKLDKDSWGPDQMVLVQNPEAKVANLEMQSDLASSINFFTLLRQALFDVTRTVDIDSIQDKIGALTNFGLKVLYQDSLAKIHTKQEIFGDMLVDLNRRMMIMGGLTNVQPVDVIWPDVLPVNESELQGLLKTDMEMGILSKQHAAQIRGYDFEQEQERIEGEQAQEQTLGGALVNNFFRGVE